MKLSRDPDTLRIPAFMRKRSLAARLKKPLVLTALDRKKAGMPVAGLAPKAPKKKKARRPLQRKKRPEKAIAAETFAAPLFDTEFFSAPLVAETPLPQKPPKKQRQTPALRPIQKSIGTITHYYNKIRVGVIALKNILKVGDAITYETPEGSYTQIVESMEIDRQPVFKAGKGKEIGLKLRKEARVGSEVKIANQ